MDFCFFSSVNNDFEFTFSDNLYTISFRENLTIPLQSNVNYREIGHQLIEKHKIPIFLAKELMVRLKSFIDDQTDELHKQRTNQLLDDLSQSDLCYNNDLIVNKCPEISTKYKSDDNINENNKFYDMYYELIHSGVFTESLMKFENTYSIAIQELISIRDQTYNDLLAQQTHEMEEAVKNIGTTLNEDYINSLSLRHFQDSEKLREEWNNTISKLKIEQKQEFYEWIRKVYEDFKNGNPESLTANMKSLSLASNNLINQSLYDDNDWSNTSNESHIQMEESFTINLGSQLKTTHNLRLISMDILDLCRIKFSQNSPQRIQTAMSLYSNSLSALVLLVDNRINSYSGIKLEFDKICSKSTEFHFPDLETQMQESKQRAEQMIANTPNKRNSSHGLQVGDFYVTKHSNLSEIHVVFHLVCDDSLRSSEINSRHPVIIGLRNIMKTSHLNDISNITIPLLLIHEMSEEITIQWCLKRAELVLKCIKGFMIEMTSLSSGSDENRTVQFVVPKDISQELFSNLTTILPSIFRLSNPLVLRSSYDWID
ncbi:protein C12orf4 homolog [Oppia nitens]|uniref:protein C12orf4 homolog n=1 Tax=Oppia nitens TaxID=1686743 RepID=UPI0023DAC08F|nr:protein C12orf4 homolog [Oppia nitens]